MQQVVLRSFVCLLSVAVLALSAHWLATTLNGFVDGFYDPFAVLATATASLTILSVITMILVEYLRKDAALNWIIFEMSWLSTLGLLWIATASVTTDAYYNSWLNCDQLDIFWDNRLIEGCKETQAIQSVSYTILLTYTSVLLVLSLLSKTHGVDVWRSAVRDAKFALQVPSTVNPSSSVRTDLPSAPLPHPYAMQPLQVAQS
ncbi:hypothetical protein EIP91_000904 [Steccherinum ochraceum]|uniref:MARVEL domain-containing protein n=1 Tax=Steccherinum ochraceum TaxID=92696 RepID=A0A4R0RHF8_9APHY|nr:hypothetical protein EIP91_000904 [Steccherinum ochraceum]